MLKREEIHVYLELILEKAMAPHSNTLAWKIPWTEEPGRLLSMGSLGVGHDWATSLSLFTFMHWRRKWQPTPVFLPRESQGWGSLVGCCLWGRRVGHDWSDLAAAAAELIHFVWQRPTQYCKAVILQLKINFKIFPEISQKQNLSLPHTRATIYSIYSVFKTNCKALILSGASLVAKMVKNLPAMQEIWVRSLGREDPLEKGMATQSSILAWRIP